MSSRSQVISCALLSYGLLGMAGTTYADPSSLPTHYLTFRFTSGSLWDSITRCDTELKWTLEPAGKASPTGLVFYKYVLPTRGMSIELKVHEWTTFEVHNGRMYYVDFSPRNTGGRVVCVDLSNGIEVWSMHTTSFENELHRDALRGYVSRRSIGVDSGFIVVQGHEFNRGFVNAFDPLTGQRVFEKRYDGLSWEK